MHDFIINQWKRTELFFQKEKLSLLSIARLNVFNLVSFIKLFYGAFSSFHTNLKFLNQERFSSKVR